jgi:hypothetical protein
MFTGGFIWLFVFGGEEDVVWCDEIEGVDRCFFGRKCLGEV